MTYEWQALDPKSAGNLVSDRDPRPFPWGYYASDDCQLASASLFFWFSSTDELLAFLLEIEPLIYLDREDEELKGIQDALRPICDKYRGGAQLPSEFIAQINEVLQGHCIIEWAGTLADLSNGRGSEFARDMLDQFRQSQDMVVETDAPVTEDELDDFVEHLQAIGG